MTGGSKAPRTPEGRNEREGDDPVGVEPATPAGSPAREAILQRLGTTLKRRRSAPSEQEAPAHLGPFAGSRPAPLPGPLEQFRTMFQSAGGEVEFVDDEAGAVAWVGALSAGTICLGEDVPAAWIGSHEVVDPAEADAALSFARAAIAETGTLVLGSRGGRRSQLLAPTHVIVVPAENVVPTLSDALAALRPDLPAALGLHSGPSKSADIGQVMVRGVHGPGRVIALIVGASNIVGTSNA